MHFPIEAAAPDGLNRQAGSAGISEVVGTSLKYHLTPEASTPEAYAAAKLLSRFRLRIETARLIVRLSGMGGASQ